MKSFIGIVGTTCVGKSDVAVQLAKMLNTEIISADSMQVYKGMDIGTAKITAEQMQGVPHYMLDVVEPNCNFSAFEYQQQASEIIDNMQGLPVVVGGTGFYFDSLLYPPEFGVADLSGRQKLKDILQQDGLDALCEILKRLDGESYLSVDLKNPVRVMRAIEIAQSGEKRCQGHGKTDPKYNCKLFVLQRERQGLYELIDRRVDQMIANGLLDEVKGLVDRYGFCDTSAFSAIGYKEIICYLKGEISLDGAVEQIKLNTRHYAKRQVTYFKRMNVYKFIDVEGQDSKKIAQIIADLV